MNREEGSKLIDQVASFGKPYPTMIFTGGDPMARKDLFQLMSDAHERGISFAVSPAVTELLTQEALLKIQNSGASSISVSLDGCNEQTHDRIRRSPGTFFRTLRVIEDAVQIGLGIQVNTAIMKQNLYQLPEIFHLIKSLGVKTWELFFLIKVGRGGGVEDLTPLECESACNFLYDASRYGMTVRTVEAPFVRRVAKQRASLGEYWNSPEYLALRTVLHRLEGEPRSHSSLRPSGTLDGDGIIFVAYDGTIHPGGLVPFALGNVKNDKLPQIYRENQLLQDIRERKIKGRCGLCDFRDVCGGSRARAFAYTEDPLSTDPACLLAASQSAENVHELFDPPSRIN